ncbi:MAG: hypothetical protein NXI01_09910 [Gammaproteobacteria bacterium]|nr:hypothetical protein [Gammaproteobacteria bacterium]
MPSVYVAGRRASHFCRQYSYPGVINGFAVSAKAVDKRLGMFQEADRVISKSPVRHRVEMMRDILKESRTEAITIDNTDWGNSKYHCRMHQEEITETEKKLLFDVTEERAHLHQAFLNVPQSKLDVETKAKLVLASLNISETSSSIPPIYIDRGGKSPALAEAIMAEHARLTARLERMSFMQTDPKGAQPGHS